MVAERPTGPLQENPMNSSRLRLIPLAIVLAVAITPAMARAIGQWRAESMSAGCPADDCGSGACGQLRSLQEWHDSHAGVRPKTVPQ
jgi:hypothetical protein